MIAKGTPVGDAEEIAAINYGLTDGDDNSATRREVGGDLGPEEYEQALLAEINGRKTSGLPKWTVVQANCEGEYPNSVLKVTYRDHRRELTQVDEWPVWGKASLVAGPDGLPDDPDVVATLIFTMIDDSQVPGPQQILKIIPTFKGGDHLASFSGR